MKGKPYLFYPWLFGLVSSLIYGVVNSGKWNPTDTTTGVLVFCAALAWGSLVFIKRGERHFLLKIYIFLSLIFSIVYIEIMRTTPVDIWMHRIVCGIIILALVLLNFMITLSKRK